MSEQDRLRFINSFKNWAPVTPQPRTTRESLRRELREHFIAKTGSETLADLSISHLASQADARVHLEAGLREDLARHDASIARFHAATPAILAAAQARIEAAQTRSELDDATAALAAARSARDAELIRLGAKRIEILGALRGTDCIYGRVIGWRDGGCAPTFPAGT